SAPQPTSVAVVHAPVLSISSVIDHIAPSALIANAQLAGQGAVVRHTIATVAPAALYRLPDTALLVLAAWALGALVMVAYLTRSQLRFAAAVRLGKAGPAVLGFLSPRIVTPDGFQDHFTAQERAAILAHERVHLARQDARINALAALLRCLCWFNPLIHLGARWLRIDQELACDASVVARSVSRRDYAEALLKSQMAVADLPLGCYWPGAQHPLVERIALLKRKPPGAVRRVLGASFVLLAAGLSGLGAWAAQPPAPVKLMAAPLPHMVALPAPGEAGPTDEAPLVRARPTSGGHAMDTPSTVRGERAISPAQARVQMPSADSIAAPTQPPVAELPPISVAENATMGKTSPAAPDTATHDAAGRGAMTALRIEDHLAEQATGQSPGHDNVQDAKRRAEDRRLAGMEDVVMAANTPSGVGDPDAMVCRVPQRYAGSDRLGPAACGHNWEWLTMAANGKDLAADGKTLIDKPTVANPTGEGDPAAVTCRTSKSAMYAPVCETNRFWADLIKNHQTIDKPTVDNPTGEGDPAAVTCRTPKFVWRGPLVEICRTNRFWADIRKNNQFVDANGAVFGRPSTPPYTGFGDIPYGPGYVGGNFFHNQGSASYPGYDSGRAWQSSEPNPGGTLAGNTAASTPTFSGYNGGCCGGGGGGGGGSGGFGGGGGGTMGGYHP
ncbi:MAG TPA: M56 family metallopeptidase, partial [Rhizomicrobium sp.]|nr:M56 family metallopeptidase [Rhizomicrobium sp.]